MQAIVSVKIDYASIRNKIQGIISKSVSIKRLAYQKAYGKYYYAKRTMLSEFDRSNVTQEILAGPRADNISGTLNGYGNLFSFIGFDEGSDPIGPLRELLETGTHFEQTVFRNSAWYFRVYLPSKGEIENVTQMPWEHGNSWAYAVERYISGLSHYMYKKRARESWPESHSGSGYQIGVQGKNDYYDYLTDANFIPHDYITEILKSFRERVNSK